MCQWEESKEHHYEMERLLGRRTKRLTSMGIEPGDGWQT